MTLEEMQEKLQSICQDVRLIAANIDYRQRVRMVLDVTDDRVHKVMQIVFVSKTPEGVIIYVRTPNERETGWPSE